MIENLNFEAIGIFLNSVFLQNDIGGLFGSFGQGKAALGSDDPIVKGAIATLFGVAGFGVIINFFNATIRRKLVDQTKLNRIMKETKSWQKERMSAMRAKDQVRIEQLNKKSSYMNKMSMEMMQMNMRPMMITFVPLILIYYLVLPVLFTHIVALSPISLNVIPGNFFHLTCTAEQALDPENFCTQENGLYLWAWYFLSSISFSGIIMKLTKTRFN